jgi:hypothetical protein
VKEGEAMEKNIPTIPGASAHFGTDGDEYWAEVILPTLDGTTTITYKGSSDEDEAAPEPAGKLRPIGSVETSSGSTIVLYSDKRGTRYATAWNDTVLMCQTEETYPFDPEEEF